MTFDAHLYSSVGEALESITDDERDNIYAVSLFVYDEEDDPRCPTVTVGTNTETQVQLSSKPPPDFEKPTPWWTPTDEPEARWNYAFWRQDRLAAVFDTGVDPVGASIREGWIKDLGLWFFDADDDDIDEADASDDEEAERKSAAITATFVAACIRLVQRLHSEGVVEGIFGRPIPLLVHELEYYDEIAEQNMEANPPGLADGLADWIASM